MTGWSAAWHSPSRNLSGTSFDVLDDGVEVSELKVERSGDARLGYDEDDKFRRLFSECLALPVTLWE